MDLRDQLAVYEQFGWINMRAITFSFVAKVHHVAWKVC